jgi:predicted GNAT family acetyltransferase
MIIQQREDGNEAAFFIEENGRQVAEMAYTTDKGRMVIHHTEVDENLRGQNIGFELIERGVEFAREAKLKVVPVCKFAKTMIERHKEFQDVL